MAADKQSIPRDQDDMVLDSGTCPRMIAPHWSVEHVRETNEEVELADGSVASSVARCEKIGDVRVGVQAVNGMIVSMYLQACYVVPGLRYRHLSTDQLAQQGISVTLVHKQRAGRCSIPFVARKFQPSELLGELAIGSAFNFVSLEINIPLGSLSPGGSAKSPKTMRDSHLPILPRRLCK